MAPVHVQLPADLVRVAELDTGNGISPEAAKLIALELFREDKISLGRAAALCEISVETFMDYAGEHGVALHYDAEDARDDLRTIERFGLGSLFPMPLR